MSKDDRVPVLITWDVDPDLWLSLEKRINAIKTVQQICADRDIHATFYFTAKGTEDLVELMKSLQNEGHEIGCHGLTHGEEEDYDRMPPEMQRDYLQKSTRIIESITGKPPRSFRSPRVKTSSATLNILADSGYWSDSSVCSQRADFISSNLINTGWLVAPRKPYHPLSTNPFRRGDLNIWEIPISALVLPFITSTMKVLGLPIMKLLFRLFYAESQLTGKPIVFLGHPSEYVGKRVASSGKKKQLLKYSNPKYLSPSYIRTYGLQLRSLLYRYDGAQFAELTRKLFSYIDSFPDVEYLTMEEYSRTRLGIESASK